uniref:Reverse transcriptase zinc-binding domain-containing protein n=1 Tax=Rhodnius prolixus TaxID=13249 RepID=T1HI43_RHOPR
MVMCYGAQVWGGEEHDEVEKLQRYFLKKLYKLPNNTPNYMLFLETSSQPLYNYTLRLHVNYLNKVLNQSPDRLTNFLAKIIIENKLSWYKALLVQAGKYNLEISVSLLMDRHLRWLKDFIGKLCEQQATILQEKVINSEFHKQYKCLDLAGGSRYINDSSNFHLIQTIFRVRGELLELNYQPWKRDRIFMCSLCNMNVNEDTYHFVSVCPVLKEFRLRSFGKKRLEWQEYIDILNGNNDVNSLNNLYKYVRDAYSYRKMLCSEFNYNN